MDCLQIEKSQLQQAKKPLQGITDFSDLDKRLNDKLNRQQEIIAGKKEKMLRDKIDYETNNVYICKCGRQWSSSSHIVGGHKKHVSFSDIDTDLFDETMAISDSEGLSILDTAAGSQETTHNPIQPKKR